jgi:hypothetical protein
LTLPARFLILSQPLRWFFDQGRGESMDRFLKWLVLGILLLLPTSSFAIQDAIGIYFDRQGHATCLPAALGRSDTAYVILKNVSCPSGVSGWRTKLRWDDGLSVTLIGIAGDGLNARLFPEFGVTFARALVPRDTAIVLATLSVAAVRPGGLYLAGGSRPPLTGLDVPEYAAGDDPTVLAPCAYEIGSSRGPVAWIGDGNCPAPNARTVRLPPEISTWGSVAPERYRSISVSSSLDIGDTVRISDLTAEAHRSDLCATGVIVSSRADCWDAPDDPVEIGAARLTVDLKGILFGPSADRIELLVERVSIPGCVTYDKSPPRPSRGLLVPGTRVLVIAMKARGSYVIGGYGLLLLDDHDHALDFGRAIIMDRDPLPALEELARLINPALQARSADVVVRGRLLSWGYSSYRLQPLAVLKGSLPEGVLELPFLSDAKETRVAVTLKPERTYVLFLRRSGDRLLPLTERWGALEIDGDRLLTDHGAEVHFGMW